MKRCFSVLFFRPLTGTKGFWDPYFAILPDHFPSPHVRYAEHRLLLSLGPCQLTQLELAHHVLYLLLLMVSGYIMQYYAEEDLSVIILMGSHAKDRVCGTMILIGNGLLDYN